MSYPTARQPHAGPLELAPRTTSALAAERERRAQAEAIQNQLFRVAAAVHRAERLVDLYEPALDAVCAVLEVDRAAVLLYDDADGVLRFKASRGLSEEYRRAVEGHSPWSRDDRAATPIFFENAQEEASLAQYKPLFEREGICAIGFIPLAGHDQLLGKFMVYAATPRRFAAREIDLATTVATQVALAVARAQLLESERRARVHAEQLAARADLLQHLSAALATVSTVAEVSSVVVERACTMLGAPSCGLWSNGDGDAVANLLAAKGLSDAAHAQLASLLLHEATQNPIAEAIVTGEPIWLSDAASVAARYPTFAEQMAPNSCASHACLPLTIESRRIGALVFCFSEPRAFSEDERHFLWVLSRHCAQAIERARLFDSEQRARATAEATLAVVSHDLRTPLGAVLLAAGNLLQIERADSAVRRNAQTIRRSAERMSRLIEDLVDFASMQAGRFGLVLKSCAPEPIVVATSELFAALAQERGVRLQVQLGASLPAVRCDHDRAVQVLCNLVSNAIKATPSAGRVTIGVEQEDGALVFFVEDTGRGLAPEELPHIFDRYFRGTGANYKGTGLGLSIAKGIIDAHGGRIWAESTLGVGSRFSFSLSRA